MKKRIIVSILLFLIVLVVNPRISPAAAANLTISAGGRVTIELTFSDADFSNTLAVVSPAVGIVVRGCQLEPAGGLTGVPIVSEKLSKVGCRVDLDADPVTPGIQPFPANTTFEFQLCAQQDADSACEFVWSSDQTKNSDNFEHLTTTPLFPTDFPGEIFQLAWEDFQGGGDQDFNDLIAVVRVQSDTDRDGLWDDWERFGIDTTGDGIIDLDLPALGANPNRQDIFVEIDYMDCNVAGGDCPAGDTHSHRPKAAAIQAAVDAFAHAPIVNPDGTRGITLHVDVNNAFSHQNFLAVGCGFGDTYFDAVKADPVNFGPVNPRRFAYHYALFAHRQAPGTVSSGCAELPGNDFIVTLGEWNTICIRPGINGVLDTTPAGDDVTGINFIFTGPNLTCNTTARGDDVQYIAQGNSPARDLDGDGLEDRTLGTVMDQAGTLAHELGHNLELFHGGDSNTNYKPNYLSVMNYWFQGGIPPTDPDGLGPLTGRIDYSSQDLNDLDENNLNETIGIRDGADNTLYFCPNGTPRNGQGTGAIDWNCDNDGGVDNPVVPPVDINRDGVIGILTGFDDWGHLKLDFQNTNDFEDGVHLTTVDLIEMDYSTYLEISGGLQPKLYLPIIFRDFAIGPDLIIEQITATGNNVEVTVKNIGNEPVKDAFWVDVYFDPSSVPGLNQRWQDIAKHGVVWGIAQGQESPLNLPINPSETRVLTLDKAYFGELGSSLPPYPAGVAVYARVDSVDFNTNHGAVLESNENNNLFGPVNSTAESGTSTELISSSESSPSDGLPSRE